MGKSVKRSTKERSKWLDTFKLLVVNDDTFEEVFAQKLTRWNVYVFLVLFVSAIGLVSFFVISSTPLKFLIPGIESTRLEREVQHLLMKTDSLSEAMRRDEAYVSMISKVIKGEIEYEAPAIDSTLTLIDSGFSNELLETRKSIAMLELESQVKKEENFSPIVDRNKESSLYFTPLTGVISGEYEPLEDHLAIDIAASEGSPVKAIAEGTVVHAEWSSSTGYNLIIAHRGEWLSVYKHNGQIFKKQGETASAGEVIASVGNTGELTSGTHLHFELWKSGKPVNPKQYINF